MEPAARSASGPAAVREVIVDIGRDNQRKLIIKNLLSWYWVFYYYVCWRRRPEVLPTSTRTVNGTCDHGHDYNKAPVSVDVLGVLTFGAAITVGLIAEFERTVGGWKTAPRVFYGLLVMLTAALLGIGLMTFFAGSRRVSDTFARLGAILSIALLIVAISCKMGPWGFAAGVPFAVVVACIMGVIWMRARAVRPRRPREQQPS